MAFRNTIVGHNNFLRLEALALMNPVMQMDDVLQFHFGHNRQLLVPCRIAVLLLWVRQGVLESNDFF